jgi:hypothetical protein
MPSRTRVKKNRGYTHEEWVKKEEEVELVKVITTE